MIRSIKVLTTPVRLPVALLFILIVVVGQALAADSTASRLKYMAGLLPDMRQSEAASLGYLEKHPYDAYYYLEPDEQLWYQTHGFWSEVDCDADPIIYYFFYADSGNIEMEIGGIAPNMNFDIVLRRDGIYPEGTFILYGGSGGYGQGESNSYYNEEPGLFVFAVGLVGIAPCNVSEYLDYVEVSLSYTPYEWDLELESLTASTPYPNDYVEVTARIRNNSNDTLHADYPFYYSWNLGLVYSGGDCSSYNMDDYNIISEAIPSGEYIDVSFVIWGPHTGKMDIHAIVDVYNDLPHDSYGGPWCNEEPTSVLWTVDVGGQITISDETTSSWQALNKFRYSIVRINGGTVTTLVDDSLTDQYGNYSATIPSGEYDVGLRLSTTGQVFPHYSVTTENNVPSQRRPFVALFNPDKQATVENIYFDAQLHRTAKLGDDYAYKAFRILQDLYLTDRMICNFDPFDSMEVVPRLGLTVEMDTTNTCTTGTVFSSAGQASMCLQEEDHDYQTASHELGHHILFHLQGVTPTPAQLTGTHWINSLSDTLVAFEEGFAELIRSLVTSAEYYQNALRPAYLPFDMHVETNTYYQGEDGDSTTFFRADSIVGCVASILYDLADTDNFPALRPTTDDRADGDEVQDPVMFQRLLDCIWNFRDSTQQTRSLYRLTERLLHDENADWFDGDEFEIIRPDICGVFYQHNFIQDADYCNASTQLDMRNTTSNNADCARPNLRISIPDAICDSVHIGNNPRQLLVNWRISQ